MTVYFIRQRGTDLVKIGSTHGDPARRLANLQIANPHVLELLAVTDVGTEREYHERFSTKRVRGEWFHLPANDIVSLPGRIRFGRPLWADRVFWEMASVLDGHPPDFYIADEPTTQLSEVP